MAIHLPHIADTRRESRLALPLRLRSSYSLQHRLYCSAAPIHSSRIWRPLQEWHRLHRGWHLQQPVKPHSGHQNPAHHAMRSACLLAGHYSWSLFFCSILFSQTGSFLPAMDDAAVPSVQPVIANSHYQTHLYSFLFSIKTPKIGRPILINQIVMGKSNDLTAKSREQSLLSLFCFYSPAFTV